MTDWHDDDPERPAAEYRPAPAPQRKRRPPRQRRGPSSPQTWTEATDRLAYALADEQDALEWIRGAVRARWGKDSLHDLTRVQRQLALQKTAGVVLALEDEVELAFLVGVRALVAATFARYFDGVSVDGPPWRIDPYEDRPTRAALDGDADFGTSQPDESVTLSTP